eukprot:630705_1
MDDDARKKRKAELARKKERLKKLRAQRQAKQEEHKKRELKRGGHHGIVRPRSQRSPTSGNPRPSSTERERRVHRSSRSPVNRDETAGESKTQEVLEGPRVSQTSHADDISALLNSFSEISAAVATPLEHGESGPAPMQVDQSGATAELGVVAIQPKKEVREIKLERFTPEPIVIQPAPPPGPIYHAGTQTDPDEIERRNAPPSEQVEAERTREEARERELEELRAVVRAFEEKDARACEAEEVRRRCEEDKSKRKELTEDEKNKIIQSSEFASFIERSSLLVERALAQPDITFDFFEDTKMVDASIDIKESVLPKFVFEDPKCKNRTIVAMDWSSKFPQLILVSYARSHEPSSTQADGLIMVWSLDMPQRPEKVFTCQSTVLSLTFHISHPHLILGGTQAGEILIWDSRLPRGAAVTTRSALVHSHPIFSLTFIPSLQSRETLISVSKDGLLCVWNDLMLVEPSHQVKLHYGVRGESLTTPSIDFHPGNASEPVLGSDEGELYKVKIYDDRPGIKQVINGHFGPITAISFHPCGPDMPAALGDLFLTSSYDWSCKLWTVKNAEPLLTFEFSKEYV